MPAIQMVCSDIDGTILNSRHQASQRTRTAILRAAQQVPFVLVSARSPKGVGAVAAMLGLAHQPMIYFSGALLVYRGRLERLAFLDAGASAKVVQLCRALGVHLSVYEGENWFCERFDPWAKQEADIVGFQPELRAFVPLAAQWRARQAGPDKLLCMAPPAQLDRLTAQLQACPEAELLAVSRSKDTYLEVGARGVSKPMAIDALARRMGIGRQSILAIGDHYNDIEMLRYAGMGVAMGQAPDPVRLAADALTLTQDEDGAALAIERYLFKET
ncbi:Cof-type HAD-IIB family hydrolase [Luoshenia tenuis]|uniref:Cof-type HAD-IIB family hydrolase n=1 Tax=Luoshenia tenuis TaxID=2763654 RepID=UPI003D91AB30